MGKLVLYIGNRNYSTWSLRAWLALEQSGLPAHVEQVWLEEDVDRRQRHALGPTGCVPVLRHGDRVIWDSLAIGEYLAELAPGASLWPAEPEARARARAICAEMHAGFPLVRSRLPMNVRALTDHREPDPDLAAEIRRLIQIWAGTREEFGAGGDFLLGRRCLADAFFAPVVFRFNTYAVPVEGAAKRWMGAMLELPAMSEWSAAAAAEGHPNPTYDALL